MSKYASVHRPLMALCALTLTASFAACGSDDKTDSASGGSAGGETASVVSAANERIQGNIKVDQIGPTVPIEGTIPKGKKLIYVNCGAPACTTQGKAFKAAAETLGWSVKEVAAVPTPQSVQAAFDEVIRQKPDAVASAGLGSTLYPKQLAELEKLKIPVVSATGTDETGTNGITFEVLPPKLAADTNAILANKTIADIGGKGEVGSVLLGGYPIVKEYTKGYTDSIKSNCPDCTVKEIEIQPTSIGKDAPDKIANFLRANPNMKALYLSYDALGLGLSAAAKGASVTLPKTYSWAPDAPGIQALQTGDRTASAMMPSNELSWQLVDALARKWAGGDVADSQKLQPIVIASKSLGNVPAKADPAPPSVADYQVQFKALWGLQ